MKHKAKHVSYLFNLDHLRKVHVRLHQYEMEKKGSCDGLGENGFPNAPWCTRVETDWEWLSLFFLDSLIKFCN